MGKISKLLLVLISPVPLLGCYTMRADYVPPAGSEEVEQVRVVARSSENIFQDIIRSASGSDLEIILMDRPSGRIDLRFSGDAERYVDCGELKVTAINILGSDYYEFPVSRGRQNFRAWAGGGIDHVEQVSRVEARATILISSLGRDRSSVSIVTNYVFRRRIQQPGAIGYSNEESASFRGSERGRVGDNPNGRWFCVSNGKLLEEVVAMISGGRR